MAKCTKRHLVVIGIDLLTILLACATNSVWVVAIYAALLAINSSVKEHEAEGWEEVANILLDSKYK